MAYPQPGLGLPDWEGTWDQWLGYPPTGKDMGPVEVLWDGDGVPPRVWIDKQTETITFPILRMRAVISGQKQIISINRIIVFSHNYKMLAVLATKATQGIPKIFHQ